MHLSLWYDACYCRVWLSNAGLHILNHQIRSPIRDVSHPMDPICVYQVLTRSQTLHTTPCDGIVSNGTQIGVFGFLPNIHAKNSVFTIFAHRATFCVLTPCSDHLTCRWHTHLTNHGYSDYRRTRRSPIWGPCRDKDAAGFGISLIYLWSMYML